MFEKIFFAAGKGACIGLYAWFGALAAKKKPAALITLAAMHLTEYFTQVRKLADDKGICQVKAFGLCMLFGFTWWVPIKKGK